MTPRIIGNPLYVVAAFACFIQVGVMRYELAQLTFGFFGLICILGLFLRWGPLIPATLIAFFIGQMLPEKHGYCHNLWEVVEHDVVDPTILSVVVAVLVVAFEWCSVQLKNDAVKVESSPSDES